MPQRDPQTTDVHRAAGAALDRYLRLTNPGYDAMRKSQEAKPPRAHGKIIAIRYVVAAPDGTSGENAMSEPQTATKRCPWWRRWLCKAPQTPIYHSWECVVCKKVTND